MHVKLSVIGQSPLWYDAGSQSGAMYSADGLAYGSRATVAGEFHSSICDPFMSSSFALIHREMEML